MATMKKAPEPDEMNTASRAAPVCFYCGMPARTRERLRGAYDKIEIVWACPECKQVSRSMVFTDALAKRRWIKDYLRRHYKKLMRSPSWSDAELEELKPRLRGHVVAKLRKQAIIEARIAWPRGRTAPSALMVAAIL